MNNIKNLLAERIELADKRNFTTIHITLKPSEALKLLELLGNLELANETLEQIEGLTSIQAERVMREALMKIGGRT
jgi:vacuolar-type H+-ATPase subunit C/Vma6